MVQRLITALVLIGLLAAACGTAETPPSTIAGAKETCEEVVLEVVPVGLSLSDRTLVPYSRTLLGVEAEYAGSAGSVSVISGGYLDDHLEPYDDLEPLSERIVLGRDASVLAGSFIDAAVLVAVWKEPGLTVPCGTRAVVAVGLDEDQFHEILDGLGTRQPGSD